LRRYTEAVMRQFRARGRARVVGDIEAALLEYVRDCFAPGITASSRQGG